MAFWSRHSTPSQRRTFTRIHDTGAWGSRESVSGPGSTVARGADFQAALLALLDRFCTARADR
jgi:hypothetical protein